MHKSFENELLKLFNIIYLNENLSADQKSFEVWVGLNIF